MAPVIAASQRAGLRSEFGAGNMGTSMGRPGAIPAFFNTQQQGQNRLGIEERPRGTKKHTASQGGQCALAILYQGSH